MTRSRRSWLAWSSGLTLWSLSALFATTLLFMFSYAAPVAQPDWMRLILPVWPQLSNETMAGRAQGWAAGLAMFFWYQTTLLNVPGRWAPWRRWSLLAMYGLGILTLLLQIFLPQLLDLGTDDPLMVDTQNFNSIYTVYAGSFLLLAGLAVYNVLEARRLSISFIAKRQNSMLLAAGLTAGLAVVLAVIGAIPGQAIPTFWISGLLIFAVGFFGFGVIRYSAILGHRILWRDLAYSAGATGLSVSLYLAVFAWLVRTYDIPGRVFVFLVPLVTLSHALTEEVRLVLERLIFDRRTRTLRANLARLSQLAAEQADLGAVLSRALETICYTVRATYGVVLVFEQERACLSGSFRWPERKQSWQRQDFEADDVRHFDPGALPEPFLETTLLIPLYAAQEQVGSLLLGRPENGIHYSREDLLVLDGSIERLAGLIVKNRRLNEYLEQVAHLPLQAADPAPELIPTVWVEDALQNIYNYAYLGDCPLAHLQQVSQCLQGSTHTHLDTGKAVHQVLARAVEKLRPEAAVPPNPIPREWFPYFILHDAYFLGLPNREITAKLYISEGTFHRTRRAAIRSVTRVLSELEPART